MTENGGQRVAERNPVDPSIARFDVLGVGVDAVAMPDACRVFEQLIARKEDRGAFACALGVAGIMEARRNARMKAILNRAALNTPDGMPLVWLGRAHGHRGIRRVYGPDLMRDVCAYSADRGWTHYLYGAAPGVAEQLKARLEERHPAIRIVGTECPPYRELTEEEDADLVGRIEKLSPDIFWVGFSTPRQLYFTGRLAGRLNTRVICPVGYAFDINAGTKQDAPAWIQYSGFQWLHRALTDPRLWKRYLRDNPRFAVEALLQLLRLRRF